MKVSVLIPYYEGQTTLPTVLEALAAQERPGDVELELVVAVDGLEGGPDRNLLARFPGPASLLHQQHRGQSAATNLAARAATGELLWLLAQDMEPRPEALVNLLATHRRSPSSLVQGLILHHPRHLEDRFTHHIVQVSRLQFAYDFIENEEDLNPGHHYAPHALVDRERFLVLGGYDETLPYGYQDCDFGIRWVLNGDRIVLAREAVVLHDHLLSFEQYRRRQYRVGRAAVDLMVKWGRDDALAIFLPSIDYYNTGLREDLGRAGELVEGWLASGREPEEPATIFGDRSLHHHASALDAAITILLGRENLRGAEERMQELGIRQFTVPPDFTMRNPLWRNPYNWITPFARQQARPRPEEPAAERPGPA